MAVPRGVIPLLRWPGAIEPHRSPPGHDQVSRNHAVRTTVHSSLCSAIRVQTNATTSPRQRGRISGPGGFFKSATYVCPVSTFPFGKKWRFMLPCIGRGVLDTSPPPALRDPPISRLALHARPILTWLALVPCTARRHAPGFDPKTLLPMPPNYVQNENDQSVAEVFISWAREGSHEMRWIVSSPSAYWKRRFYVALHSSRKAYYQASGGRVQIS